MYLDRSGLLAVHNDMQQGHVSYYHSNWSSSLRLDRFFLNK